MIISVKRVEISQDLARRVKKFLSLQVGELTASSYAYGKKSRRYGELLNSL